VDHAYDVARAIKDHVWECCCGWRAYSRAEWDDHAADPDARWVPPVKAPEPVWRPLHQTAQPLHFCGAPRYGVWPGPCQQPVKREGQRCRFHPDSQGAGRVAA
jgi:hypothetical protein